MTRAAKLHPTLAEWEHGTIRSWVREHFSVEGEQGDELAVRCRLHDDQHASCSINVKKAAWHCHACDRGGKLSDLARELGLPSPLGNGRAKEPDVVYHYHDAGGALLFDVIRFPGKQFRQRAADGTWKVRGIEQVPYRLPELLAAIKGGKAITITEGEKDVATIVSLDGVGTTNAGGAGKWKESHSRYFPAGIRVNVIGDADIPGQAHVRSVGEQLARRGCDVRIVDLGYPIVEKHGKDVSDWVAEGHTRQELIERIKAALPFAVHEVHDDALPGDGGVQEQGAGHHRETQSERLLKLAAELVLFHDGETPYATVPVGDHREIWKVGQRAFREWLAARFFRDTGSPPGNQALSDVVNTCAGLAKFQGEERRVQTRIAGDSKTIWLDLCNPDWEVVKITADGWTIVADPPIRFRRARGMRALPHPELGGSLAPLLAGLLNLSCADDGLLVAGWLLGALRPAGPYPVLCLHGEQGSAKSTAARILRGLIDPNDSALRTAPREERDLIIAASNGWVINLDNMSHLPTWLSDALCRISTGGGFATRELYSNDEEVLFTAMRPTILNGISDLATRGDLVDRSILLTLPVVPENRRFTEAMLWRTFEEERPKILGALLDAVSCAIRELPNTHLERLPRMADFALWVTAAEEGLKWDSGSFLLAYRGNRDEANESVLEASVVGMELLGMIRETGGFEGTSGDLLEKLTTWSGERSEKAKQERQWPRTPKGMSSDLRRLAPTLRAAGVSVSWPPRQGPARSRMVSLRADGRDGLDGLDAVFHNQANLVSAETALGVKS